MFDTYFTCVTVLDKFKQQIANAIELSQFVHVL